MIISSLMAATVAAATLFGWGAYAQVAVGGTFAAATEEANGTAALAPGAKGHRVVRAQILLDRARFSPGEIDGVYGEDLGIAVRGYQASHGLKADGTIDAAMWRLLDKAGQPVLRPYLITVADRRGPFVALPAEVQEKAKLKRLGFESLEEELGERFHCSPALLAELNPGIRFGTPGQRIFVPNVRPAVVRLAARVSVSKSKRTVTVYSSAGVQLAQYPATMGGPHDPLPIGQWKITSVVHYPWFNWDPTHFWNVDSKLASAVLAPGPNNPAGAAWIGLSKENYGIHGTPEPGHIRHDTSYGCIRLTNWDVDDLSRMVKPGTPILLEE